MDNPGDNSGLIKARVCSVLLIAVLILLAVNGIVLFKKMLGDVTGFETVGEGTEDEYSIYKLNGTAVSGFYYAGGGICYFDENGRQVFGFQKVGDYTYYFSSDTGLMVRGASVTLGDTEYSFDVYGRLIPDISYEK